MKKISFDDWKNSMSFLIDDEFDNNFLQSIKPIAQYINKKAKYLNKKEELSKFLTIDDEFKAVIKLKAFVALIGLSEERLKRVVSLLRYQVFRSDFKTEWGIERISSTLKEDEKFRSLLVDLFILGRNSDLGVHVPLYYMRYFNLQNQEFISDLENYKYVERILNENEIQGKYSNEVGALVERSIKDQLDHYKIKNNANLIYDMQKEFPLLNKNIDFLIPSVKSPIILIESSYNITTGSGQSKRADQLVDFFSTLMKHNANHRSKKILMLNYCDGFGWVGRQNDLRRIYDASDYVFNQMNLRVLVDVLNEFYPRE